MNKLITRRLKTVMVFSLLISSVTFAQFSNVDFLRSGKDDAGKIVKAYAAPWANAFGAALNGGWYNTAKPHKLGGFDITGNISVGMVPKSAETYSISSLGLSSNFTVSGNTNSPSTIAGPDLDGPTLDYKISGLTLASFKLPPGTTWKLIPSPIIQAGIGLPLGTEVKLRYMPKMSIKEGDITLWGVGLMHSIMQYIPGHKLIPVLDVSLFGGYTKLEGNVHLALKPESTVVQNYTAGYLATNPFDNQNLNVTVTAMNVNALVCANLRLVTFYGGLGYTKNSTVISLKGNFPIPVPVLTPTPHAEYNNIAGSGSVIPGSDFKNLEIKDFSGLRANIGVRFKFGVFTMHADYTRAMYNVVSAGLGLSFK
jgi:hypothetical protein